MIRIVSVVSNDIVTDNRIHKIAVTLSRNGYQITIAGRRLRNSLPLSDRHYATRRFRLLFKKGPAFYACLNIRIFIYLLISRPHIILSNDLDTLLGCFLASRATGRRLVFDSHELFPEVPELVNRPGIRKIWLKLEKYLVPKIHFGFTVCDSIAEYYKDKYNIAFAVIRNLSRFRYDYEFAGIKKEDPWNTIIYQGSLNIGRGLELAIESMRFLDGIKLLILGDGDIRSKLIKKVKILSLENKVEFPGKVAIENLWKYTASANIGLSLEEDLGLNYKYALPNKLFDYVQARIPVIISDLPEMKAIITRYGIGKVLEERTPQKLAEAIHFVVDNLQNNSEFNTNIELAARELCWEKEEDKLLSLFRCVSTSI